MTDLYCDGCIHSNAPDRTPGNCKVHDEGKCPFEYQIEQWERMIEEERRDLEPPEEPNDE